MSVIELVNDNYIVLKVLYDNQVTVLGETQIPLTQLDIGKSLGFSKNKVYSIFKTLQKQGYIETAKRGKYRLTDSAIVIIEDIKRLEEKLNKKESR